MYIPNIINENSVTVILNGRPIPISPAHINYKRIRNILITGADHADIEGLLNVAKSVEQTSGGDVVIRGNAVLYKGRRIMPYLETKLFSMIKQGHKNINPLKAYIGRVEENESFRAREQIAKFADYRELPFDEQGFLYAYKGIAADGYSVRGNTQTRVLKGKTDEYGRIWNGVGEEIIIDRRDACDDCTISCGPGLHCGSFDYASNWGAQMVLVKIDPKDVVSVPSDCGCQKMRVCHYWVVSKYERKSDIHHAIITDEKITDKGVEDFLDEQYLKAFKDFIRNTKVRYTDSETIIDGMKINGYLNIDKIEKLLLDYEIATKMFRYIENKGGEAPYKMIQSALKMYSLKYADIERIEKTYGDLF